MKYICMKNDAGMEEMFLFPRWVNHDCMEEALARIKDQTHGNWLRELREPISAGFVSATLNCHGKSETLGLDSRGEIDTKLLKDQLST
jgi:hypothetical protein